MPNRKPTHEDAALIRLLLGEISPDERSRLEQRLDEDATLRVRLEQLRGAWDSLEMAPSPALPEGFRTGVLEAVRGQARASREVGWSEAPAWARAAAGVTLALGIAVGLGVGHPPPLNTIVSGDSELEAYLINELESAPLSLAEAYWLELEEQGEALWNESAWGDSADEEKL